MKKTDREVTSDDPYSLRRLAQAKDAARAMGGPEKVARQHQAGRLTARERIDVLLDDNTFHELGLLAHSDRPADAHSTPTDGKITGYTTGVGFDGHGVGESNDDLKALIASVDEFAGPGVLIPTTNGELFRWCLEKGLRVSQQLTLMDTAPEGPPNGAYWPSILC